MTGFNIPAPAVIARTLTLLVFLSVLVCAQQIKHSVPSAEADQRKAVIETKIDNLKALDDRVFKIDDRVSKLGDKIDTLTQQLTAVTTKLELIQWFGGALGVVIVGLLWISLLKKSMSRGEDHNRFMLES